MSASLCQPDDNMIPGQTYTFQFKLANWIEVPSTSTIQSDIAANAPAFVANVQVTSPSLTSLYNVQFDYQGDGSDVISDVANSLLAAFQQGSGDNFTFIGAVSATAQSITVSLGSAAQTISDSVGTAVNSAIQGAAKTAAQSAQTVLSPIELALVLIVGLAAFLIFTSGKAGGVSAGPGGLDIGGK